MGEEEFVGNLHAWVRKNENVFKIGRLFCRISTGSTSSFYVRLANLQLPESTDLQSREIQKLPNASLRVLHQANKKKRQKIL